MQKFPENRLLDIFVGTWRTTGEVVATSDAPAVRIDAIDTYEWLPGKYALIHYADSSVGDDKIHAIEILGWDPVRKMYYGPFFDDQGGAGFEEIGFDGKIWTWRGENVMGVNFHRCLATFADDGNTIHARHEQSDDDIDWKPWMNVTLRKQH